MTGDAIVQELQDYFNVCSKHKIENIITLANTFLKKRFVKRSKPKYGNLSKYITQSKWETILSATSSVKIRFAFYLMRKLALRVGEVPELNINNINIKHKQLFIPRTEKSGMPDLIYLDDECTQKLKEWIDEHYKHIKMNSGYLLYSDNPNRNKISKNCIRNIFRQSCRKIQIKYGEAENTNYDLNLYTTHSCRHSGITDFYARCKDLILTKNYARHQDINSTLVYIHCTEKEMRRALDGEEYSAREVAEVILLLKSFKRKI